MIETLESKVVLSASLTTLYTLNDSFISAAGSQDVLIMDRSGDLYGTSTGDDSSSGSIFEFVAGSHTPITLAQSVRTANGTSPGAELLTDSAGNAYGWTLFYDTASPRAGDVFDLVHGTSTVTLLGSDHSNDPDYLSVPGKLVLDSSGNLIGSTDSKLFEINLHTKAFTSLATTSSFPDYFAQAGLIADPKGNVFGEMEPKNSSGNGLLFEVQAGTHSFKVIASFDGKDGNDPRGNLVLNAKGDLFGTTAFGGKYGQGTIFELQAGSKRITALASFRGSSYGGASNLILANGKLYGSTEPGKNSTIFGFDLQTNILSTYTAPGQVAGLLADALGDIYGTTSTGGNANLGTIFELSQAGGAVGVLAVFDGSNGQHPTASLLADSLGNIYGETSYGSPSSPATVFELTGSGFATSAPTISVQPLSSFGVTGHTVTFFADSESIPASTVKWQQSSDGGLSFADVTENPTAATDTLVLTKLRANQSGMQYRAVFNNALGSVSTPGVTLTVLPPLKLEVAAHSEPMVVTGTSATLRILASDPSSTKHLSYLWSVLHAPPGAKPVTFSVNGSFAARKSVAKFYKSGGYTLRCTISDRLGRSLTSDVFVNVKLS